MHCGGVEPPELFQLAGHPVRWSLLSELARSDRTVQELTGLVGEAQNLVSYHLGKLRDSGLVSTRRSSADGRDAYYAADLTRFGDLLSSTVSSLHPGLRVAPRPGVQEMAGSVRVLFLCTGNSARSQIAEALVRARSGGTIEVCSAGSHPKPMHRNTLRILREELGLDPADYEPKHLDWLAGERFDWVISLCDKVREICPEFPGEPETVHWSIPDPSVVTGDHASWKAFQALTAELEMRIGFLLAVVAETAPAT
jgi:ArsR family transcriptional regulator, arsenate/arsenite/antimonite-responsive transcriptional repressor / arsenate reductase (thioredoxin)